MWHAIKAHSFVCAYGLLSGGKSGSQHKAGTHPQLVKQNVLLAGTCKQLQCLQRGYLTSSAASSSIASRMPA